MCLEPSERAKGKRSLEKVGEKEKVIVCEVVVVVGCRFCRPQKIIVWTSAFIEGAMENRCKALLCLLLGFCKLMKS